LSDNPEKTLPLSGILKASDAKHATAWKLPRMGAETSPLKVVAPEVVAKTVAKKAVKVDPEPVRDEKAYQAGFEEGKEAGLKAGHEEAIQKQDKIYADIQNNFNRLFESLNTPFKELDDQVDQEIISLVMSLVKQVVSREIQTDSGLLIGVVREALNALPVSARDIRIILNPEDIELVNEIYASSDSENTWKLEEDPMMTRGGCKVITETSRIDATLDSRIDKLLAPILAGRRQQDTED